LWNIITHQKNHSVEKIEYQTGPCFGTCPEFKITINKDRVATYEAIRFNKDEINSKNEGFFHALIDVDHYERIVSLLDYIDFEKLKDSYRVNWTDDQTCILKITYDNGKSKEIEDYGLLGSFGLSNLYKMLFDLRNNQHWE
jgi:hypothetical protein